MSSSAASSAPSSVASGPAAKVGSLTYEQILDAKVQPLDTDSKQNPLPELKAASLRDYVSEHGAVVWLVRRPGCALCRAEAAQIVPMYEKYFGAGKQDNPKDKPALLCLVKENLDDELRSFLPSISPSGTLLLHADRSLYQGLGAKPLRWWDLLSWGMLRKHSRDKAAHGGNMKGEGMVKGALLVLGSAQQGILAAHLEEFGKEPDLSAVEKAMQQMTGETKQETQ